MPRVPTPSMLRFLENRALLSASAGGRTDNLYLREREVCGCASGTADVNG